jgi:serine protease
MAGGAYTLVFTPQSIRSVLPNKQDPTTALLNKLKSDPNVVYAVEDRKGHLKPLPKGPEPTEIVSISHDVQWDEFERPGGVMLETLPYLRDGAWAYTSGLTNPSTVVAVLDTGITEHESLSRNLLRDESGKLWGWNFAANNSDLSDETESFHGTHVSGTIAGYGERVKGMGEDLKILTLKIPDASGMFYESAVINAIHWAVGNHVPGIPDNPYPAKVLNMSFGVDEKPGKEIDHCDAALQEALWAARQRGAVVVVAAGNDNRWEHFNAPAVCNGTIKVASTGPKGTRAYYSNYGPSVTFAAPGGDLSSGNKADGILSTVHPNGGYNGSGYDFYQGTSMASPHVAGVAALVYATSNSSLSPEQV